MQFLKDRRWAGGLCVVREHLRPIPPPRCSTSPSRVNRPGSQRRGLRPLPPGCPARVFRVIADSSIEELKQLCDTSTK
jgi:hypothetical protein